MAYLSIALALVAIIVGLYYIYIKQRSNFFKKHGILHVPPLPLLGNMGALITRQRTIHEVVQKSYDLHPDAKYVGFYEFTRPILMLRDPELIKTVTAKNFEYFPDHRPFVSKETDPLLGGMLFQINSNQWKDERSILTPMFTSSKIKNMFNVMENCAVRFAALLAKLPEREREVEMKTLVSRYTNDVIANCVYGVSVDTMSEPKNIFYVYGRKSTTLMGFGKSLKMLLMRNMPSLAVALGVRLVEKHISKFFEDQVVNSIKEREETGSYRQDMMQLLIDSKNKKDAKKVLSNAEMAAHAFSFFFGGFDTVSSQVTFVSRLLAEHPTIQARLQEEIDEAMEKTNGRLSYEVMNEMKYLDAVINETLRLYPIVVFLDRLCVKDFELPPALPGAKPFTVPEGMNIWLPVTALHMDPKYFDHPEEFDPDRFLNDGKRIMNSGCYLPFGLGPRMCIGNRFALAEIKVLLCHLLARCDIKIAKKTVLPLQLEKGVLNVSMVGGSWLKVEPRKNPSPSVCSNGTENGIVNGICTK